MPFPPYEALHFVHCGLQRTAAPMEQMICSSCCWHLFGRFLGRRPCVKHTHVSTMIITTVFRIASECNTNKVKDYSDAFTRYAFLPGCFRSRHSKYLNSRLPAYDRGSSLLSYHFQECCGLDDCCTYLFIAKHLNRL